MSAVETVGDGHQIVKAVKSASQCLLEIPKNIANEPLKTVKPIQITNGAASPKTIMQNKIRGAI
jgi:hypothetical protein